MKKLTVILLTSLVCIALMTGCGNRESAAVPAPPLETPTPLPVSPPKTVTTPANPEPPLPSPSPSAPAPYSIEVSGNFQQISGTTDFEGRIDYKYVQRGTSRFDYTGTLEGQVELEFDMEVGMAGKITGTSTGTFKGKVEGKEGTFTFRDKTTGQMLAADSGKMSGTYTIISGTGELDDMHGVIFLASTFDADGTTGIYAGALGFGMEPETLPAPPALETAFDTNISGTVLRTEQVDNSPPVTKNGKYTANRTVTWEVHGDLEGTWVRTGISIVDMKTGDTSSEFDSTFTGTVKGREGTFTAEISASGQFFSQTHGVSTNICKITGGTGELAGLSGSITVNTTSDESGSSGTYTGTLDFPEEEVTPAPAETEITDGTYVSGTVVRIERVDNSPPVTENGKYTANRTSILEVKGGLEGKWVYSGTSVVNMMTGKSSSEFDSTFTGTVKGRQGTFTAKITVSGQFYSEDTGFSIFSCKIISGTGELTGIHGKIQISAHSDASGLSGSYAGAVHFGAD
jgi:hypothetical protein